VPRSSSDWAGDCLNEESAIGANDPGLRLEWTTLIRGSLQGFRNDGCQRKTVVVARFRETILAVGVVRDVSGLTFNELAEEREPLAVGRGAQRTTNLPCDEHFQMSHDLTEDDRVRSKQTNERESLGLGRTGRSVLKGMDRGRT